MERRFEYHALTVPVARALLASALPGHRLRSLELLTEGYINTNYKLHVADRDTTLVLRIYARDPAACRKEIALFRLMRGRVPVPEILFADAQGGQLGKPYTISKWVDGIKARTVIDRGARADVVAVGAAIGAVLGEIGKFTFDRSGFFDADLAVAQPLPGTGLGYVRHCLTQPAAAERLGRPLHERVLAFVDHHEPLLHIIGDARSLVHADFSLDNLLVRQVAGKWSVAAVLDWEFACATSPLFDIGILLRHDPYLNSPFVDAVISAFRQHGTLPPDWKRLARLVDLNNLCDFLVSPSAGVHRAEVVRRLLEETVANWDALA